MEKDNLIYSLSGIRRIAGNELNFNVAKKIAIAYGSWFDSEDKRVIIGRDTRPSRKKFEKATIEGLIFSGNDILQLNKKIKNFSKDTNNQHFFSTFLCK